MLGDGLAQLALGEPFDVARNMRMASYGLLIGGPSGHMWHKFLDATVMPHAPKSTRAVLSKLAADQLAFAPLANVALFAFIECTKGTPQQTLFVIQVGFCRTHLATICSLGLLRTDSLADLWLLAPGRVCTTSLVDCPELPYGRPLLDNLVLQQYLPVEAQISS